MSDLSGSNWTEIDAGNNTTPPLGWPEGQMPSTVNDCARMMMGALKRMWNRINGVVTTTGGGYTYTTANTTYPSAYVTGETYRFKAHRTSTGNDAMQVNSLAAKPLYKRSSGGAVPIGAGDIVAGDMVSVTYDGSLNASAGGFWCGDNIGSLQKTDATVTYVNKSGDTINNYLNVTGPISANGQVNSTGTVAGYSFTSRDNSGQQWLWYADNNTAHLWMNGGIKMNVDSGGNGNVPGSLTAAYITSTGNVNANNSVTAAYITSSGNVNANGSITASGNISASGQISAGTDLYAVNIHAASGNLTAGALGILGTSSLGGTTYTHNVLAYSDNAASVGLGGAAYSGMWAYGFTTVSDQQVKGNIGPLPPGSLDMVQTVMPHTYTFTTGPDQQTRHAGFIAQEVYQALQATGQVAGYVLDKDSGIAGLRYDELVCVLWSAVQELTARVKVLETAG